MKRTFTTTTYVICHGAGDVVHSSKVEAGSTLRTGQPNVEEFDNEDQWKARIQELGGDSPDLGVKEGPAGPRTKEQIAAAAQQHSLKIKQRSEQKRQAREQLKTSPPERKQPKAPNLSKEERISQRRGQRMAQREERQGFRKLSPRRQTLIPPPNTDSAPSTTTGSSTPTNTTDTSAKAKKPSKKPSTKG